MKTIFTLCSLACVMLVSFSNLKAQECSDLIISEVVEGWSNNKAVEIYNTTASPIDASPYGLVRFQNGNTTPGNITYLEGITIAPYDVVVVVLDKRDPDGTGFEAPVWDELQAQSDMFVNPDYNNGQEVMYYNGNDALALLTDEGQTLVDVFGKIGDAVNPDGWGGYIDSEGEQAYISQDHTLIRKSTITEGYTENPETFTILNEYDSLPANTFDQLGFHLCACDINNVLNIKKDERVKLFPNPVENGYVTLAASSLISSYEVYAVTGNMIKSENLGSVQSAYLDFTEIPAGSYYIRARLESGIEVNQMFIKK